MINPRRSGATTDTAPSSYLSHLFWSALLSGALIGVVWLTLEAGWISDLSAFVSRESPLLFALDFSQKILLSMGYPGLVLIIFTENVFPPIPSDVILPLAGYTAATTTMTLFGAIVATTGGSLFGAVTLYYTGAWLGESRVRRFCRTYGKYLTFEERELDKSLDWFQRHGSAVVLVARVVPVFRSLISIPAGLSGMPMGRFLFFTAIGAGIWNTGLIMAGYLLGSNWGLVVDWLDKYQFAMIGLNTGVFLVVAALRIRSYRRRLRQRAVFD